MEMIKKFGPGAVLAVAGVKASELVGLTKPWQQIAAAIVGAGLGLFAASKI